MPFKEHLQTAASENWKCFIPSQVCVCKKDVLNNFTKLKGKQLCRNPFFNKADGLEPAILLKKETPAHVHFCEFFKTFKSIYQGEHLLTVASGNGNCLFLRRFVLFEVQCYFNEKVRAGNKTEVHDKARKTLLQGKSSELLLVSR